jgi:photosystem II stability/assembly factor-like uncharacterized protein
MNDGGNIALSPHDPNIAFTCGNVYNSAYYFAVGHSTDAGATWQQDTITLGSRAYTVAFDPVDPNRVYVGGDSAYSYPCVLISTDLGSTWTMSRTGLTGMVYSLAVDPTDPDLLYAGNSTGVFRSTDAGATWTSTPMNRNTRCVIVDGSNTDVIYAGTYGYGVQRSTDAGLTWSDFSTGLTCNKVLSMSLRPSDGTLMAGTEGGAVFRTDVPTAVAQPGRSTAPRRGLAVTPNPCRTTACIEFTPNSAGPVTAAVFDHSGRRVLDLGTRELAAAPTTWRIDARGLAAGTYFVRVTGAGSTRTARLTVTE